MGDFTRVVGREFHIGDATYYYLGANYWQAMYLEGSETGRTVETLAWYDVTGLRVMGTTQGPGEKYRVIPGFEDADGSLVQKFFDNLDELINAVNKKPGPKIRLVVVIQNFWHWSGGMAQYVRWNCSGGDIPYPNDKGNDAFFDYVKQFYKCKGAKQRFKDTFNRLASHANKDTKVLYRDEPAIMAWELANEPIPVDLSQEYTEWIEEAAAYIKQVDPLHLVSIGSLGPDHDLNYRANSALTDIDYMTVSIWPERWGWYDPNDSSTLERAKKMTEEYLKRTVDHARLVRKPLVISAFALSRDGNSSLPNATTNWRDSYYEFVLALVYTYAREELIAGVNFWGWSRETYPTRPGELWAEGDPVLGDTADQPQGKWAVYSRDRTTLTIISKYGGLMSQLPLVAEIPSYVWFILLGILGGLALIIVTFSIVSWQAAPRKKSLREHIIIEEDKDDELRSKLKEA